MMGSGNKTLPILVNKELAQLDMVKATLTKGKTFELKPAFFDGKPETHILKVEGIADFTSPG